VRAAIADDVAKSVRQMGVTKITKTIADGPNQRQRVTMLAVVAFADAGVAFNVVDNEHFRDMARAEGSLRKTADVYHSSTLSNYLPFVAAAARELLLAPALEAGVVAASADGWTGPQRDHFVGLTFTFVDPKAMEVRTVAP